MFIGHHGVAFAAKAAAPRASLGVFFLLPLVAMVEFASRGGGETWRR